MTANRNMTLSFDLPECETEAKIALYGSDYFGALHEIREELRRNRKYDQPVDQTIENINRILIEIGEKLDI